MKQGIRSGVLVLALGIALLAPIEIVHAQTTVAGFTPGSFRVNETGAATYTIPLQVPPGIAGMEPKLALTYNSQAGNGLLGMGWSLSGLSAITRCPQTMAQDGVKGGINYDLNDRYCLDGQRLVAISGAYGADGTEYRTERESFTRVISYGVAGNGPAWFKAWTKSGQVLEYGNTADSRIEAQGKTTVRVYALNKISDTKSNYLTVTYTEDNPNGNFYPSRIDYTGNAGANLSPTQSVQFSYQARTDVAPQYVAGSVIKTTNRLTNATTYVGVSVVKNYRLAYDNNGALNRSRVANLTACDRTDGANCLPATTFGWQSGNTGFSYYFQSYPPGYNYLNPSPFTARSGDFNGDGKTDYIRMGGTFADTYLSSGDGFSFTLIRDSYLPGYDYGQPTSFTTVTGDFNGDGKTDYARLAGTFMDTYLSNGNGTFALTRSYPPGDFGFPSPWGILEGDFDGDGRGDFMRLADNRAHVFLSNGDGTFRLAIQWYPTGWNYGMPSSWTSIAGDFNGDGKTDYARLSGIAQHVFLSNGDGQFSYLVLPYPAGWDFGNPSSWTTITGDFNGDGKMDYARLVDNRAHIFLSNGDGTFSPAVQWYEAWMNFGNPSPWKTVTGDFNGDGKTDYARLGGTAAHVFFSVGDGTFVNYVQSYPAGWDFSVTFSDIWPAITGDFNGDGITDYLRLGSVDSRPFLAASPIPDILATITDALGAVTSITTKSLTDPSVYVKDASAFYPVLDIQAPLYVVSSYTTSDGVGGNYLMNYTYMGAKIDLSGRGFLGFRQTQGIDPLGLKTVTTFRQDWPYVGLATQVKKSQASGAVLNQVDNTLGCSNPATGALCTVAVGNRYFPFVSQSVETSYELTGAALPTVTTTTTYDLYGNATGITVSTGDGYSKATTNTYTNDTTNWFLGRLTRSQVTSTTP